MAIETATVLGVPYSGAEILTVLGGFLTFIIVSVRVEVKTSQNTKDIEKLDTRATVLESSLAVKLSSIEKSLAKIEGKLSIGESH